MVCALALPDRPLLVLGLLTSSLLQRLSGASGLPEGALPHPERGEREPKEMSSERRRVGASDWGDREEEEKGVLQVSVFHNVTKIPDGLGVTGTTSS